MGNNLDPDVIYAGDIGFDPRMASIGYYGAGCYAADNFNYSHRYRHPSAGMRNTASMLICDVIVGNSYEPPYNQKERDLRAPPYINGVSGRRYDSVKATHDGCTMYVTYGKERMYPKYLVTYEWE